MMTYVIIASRTPLTIAPKSVLSHQSSNDSAMLATSAVMLRLVVRSNVVLSRTVGVSTVLADDEDLVVSVVLELVDAVVVAGVAGSDSSRHSRSSSSKPHHWHVCGRVVVKTRAVSQTIQYLTWRVCRILSP